MRRPQHRLRILAIDPTSRGFGFVVLETPGHLIDWGLRQRPGGAVLDVRTLLELYRPHRLVVERCSAPGCRRGQRARQLIAKTTALASQRRIVVRSVAAREVRRGFAKRNAANKADISAALVDQFPELEPHLPRRRKPWMSEDERMAIFDALAFSIFLLL